MSYRNVKIFKEKSKLGCLFRKTQWDVTILVKTMLRLFAFRNMLIILLACKETLFHLNRSTY